MSSNTIHSVLKDDIRGQPVLPAQGCPACPCGLVCRTVGVAMVNIEKEGKHAWSNGEYTYFARIPNCPRPLGFLSHKRKDILTELSHQYLWFSPYVPIRIKLDMLVEAANEGLRLYEGGIGVRDKGRGMRMRDAVQSINEVYTEYCKTESATRSHQNVPTLIPRRTLKRGLLSVDGENFYLHCYRKPAETFGPTTDSLIFAHFAVCYVLPLVLNRRDKRKETFYTFINAGFRASAGLITAKVVQRAKLEATLMNRSALYGRHGKHDVTFPAHSLLQYKLLCAHTQEQVDKFHELLKKHKNKKEE